MTLPILLKLLPVAVFVVTLLLLLSYVVVAVARPAPPEQPTDLEKRKKVEERLGQGLDSGF